MQGLERFGVVLTIALAGCGQGSAVEPKQQAAAQEEFIHARRLARDGKPREAAESFEVALELDPGHFDAWLQLGQARLHLSDVVVGTPTRDREMLASAVAALEEACELRPEDALARHWLGQALAVGESPALAIPVLEEACALDQTQADSWDLLGLVLVKVGREEDAMRAFERALELEPDRAGAWYQLGLLQAQADRFDDAVRSFERSLEIDWTVPAVYSSMSQFLRRSGDLEGSEQAKVALRVWSTYGAELKERIRAANADRSEVEGLLRVAETFMRGYRYGDAEPWINRALRRGPESEEARALRARWERESPAGLPEQEGRFVQPKER